MKKYLGLYCLYSCNSDSISCVEYKRERAGQYKYLINCLNCMNFAFKTESGFKEFLKSYGLKKVGKVEHRVDYSNGEKFDFYYLSGNFIVLSFWHKYDLPKGVNKFIGLSNGSYVDCYYKDINGVRVIFEPNQMLKKFISHILGNFVKNIGEKNE